MSQSSSSPTRFASWAALALFTVISVFCLVDYFVMGALLNPVKTSLGLTDEQLGRVGLTFTLANIAALPFFGFFGDRYPRKWLILFGLVLWSVATVGSGLSQGLGVLLVWRAIVGIGEGSFRSLAPSWLGDLFGSKFRCIAFALYTGPGPAAYMIAYVFGGEIGEALGWHAAFFIAGIPGLILALLFLFLKEPVRGSADGFATPPPKPTLSDALVLLRDPLYLLIIIGAAAYTFSLGGLSFWGSAYFHRAFGTTNRDATHFFGMGYLFPGAVSTLIGGFIAGWLHGRVRAGYAWWLAGLSLLSFLTIIPALLATNLADAEKWIWIEIIFAVGGSAVTAPLLFETVPISLRASALAGLLVVSGVGGNLLQTWGMGILSDRIGLHNALFAVPTVYLLGTGIWTAVAVLLLRRARAVIPEQSILDEGAQTSIDPVPAL